MTKKDTPVKGEKGAPVSKRVTFYRHYHDVEQRTEYRAGSTYRPNPILAQAVVDMDCAVWEGSVVPVAAELDEARRRAKLKLADEAHETKRLSVERAEDDRIKKLHDANKGTKKAGK